MWHSLASASVPGPSSREKSRPVGEGVIEQREEKKRMGLAGIGGIDSAVVQKKEKKGVGSIGLSHE